MTLVQQLLKKGVLNKERATSLEFEIKSSGKKEEELVLERKIVPEDFLFTLKSENLKIPLKKPGIKDVPLKILEFIPEESARFYQMIPLGLKDKVLEVGMVYPEDLKAQEALKFLARRGNFSYRVFLVLPSDYKKLFSKYRSLKREVIRALEELEMEMETERIKKRPTTSAEFERLAEEAPISKVVAVVLRHAVEGKSSDIHIEPTRDKLRVRFRLLGSLHSSILLPLRIHPAVVARIKILSDLRIDEARIPQDGRFSTKVEERDIDFRVSTFPTVLGEKVAVRVLDPLIGFKSFDELGMDKRNFVLAQKAVNKPFGLILAVGPTGCGKTTTLYAMLRRLNSAEINIVTLEDPVEYFTEGVNQSQIRPEIDYSFAQGLRHVLRQDPDVIMVGEIRDQETASLTIHAALTGHIVLSTLHTTNVLAVIPRLLDLGVQSYLLPSTLSLVIAQRLVRELCSNCKKQIKPKPEIREWIMKEIKNLPALIKNGLKIPAPLVIYEPKGCKKCSNVGFAGQIGMFELLSMTSELGDIILQEPSEANILKEFKRQGMATMRQDGVIKALQGVTTIEEVMRVTKEE